MRIVDLSIKRPVAVTVIIIALLVMGFISYRGLNLNDMPQADIPMVSVTVTDRGVSPDQMETKIAKKLEEAVGEISGVKHITTNVSEGFCSLIIEFNLEKSPDIASQEVQNKIAAIRQELPDEMDEPVVSKRDLTASPILSLAVTGDMDSRVLSKLVDDVITKRLFAVKGVGSVDVYGKEEREIQIKADLEKLAAYGLSPTEMVAGVVSGNLEKPGGTVQNGSQEISLRTDNNVKSVEDFYNISVGTRAGYDIKIQDVARVSDGVKEMTDLSFYDGKPAVGIDVSKQSGSNTVAVADSVKQELILLDKVLPDSVKIEVVRDNSESIRDSVNEVVKTIIEGCILAVIIVFLFLGEWETTLISAVSLPVSIITTFSAMKVMNFSLNTMSLMALSLAVGLLIDDAIVVIENVIRHLHMGKTPLRAAIDGTTEIGPAVLATTMAVVAVFIPIGMVSGIIGKFFIEFGLTVAFSMLVSLFISFTLVPMMSSKMLQAEKREHTGIVGRVLTRFNQAFDRLGNQYGHVLETVLKHRWKTLVVLMLVFVGSLTMIPKLGFAFIPSTDNGQINITANLDSGLTLEARGEKAHEIEALILKNPAVSHIYTTVDSDSATVFVALVDKKERKETSKQLSETFRKAIQTLSGVEFQVMPGSLGPSSSSDVSFIIQGEDLEQIRAIAQKGEKMLKEDPHSRDVSLNDKIGKLETRLELDRDLATDQGIDVSMAAETLKALYDGIDAGKFDWNGDRYNIRMSVEDAQKTSLDSLDGIYVTGSGGQQVSLSSVTRKVITTSESSIHRYDRMKQIEISANVYGMATGDYLNTHMAQLKAAAADTPGVFVSTGGSSETMQDGFGNLVISLLMGIMFMYMIMAMQFESFLEPIAIMFALPMALIGAVIGLFVAGSELSIMALIGVILLMGLVAKNGILLVDFAKQKLAEGLTLTEALIEAGQVRLRPILMTTLAMIFGMIPIATATGAGTEMRAPMGHAVIGGLISSTILTLFVVPVVYSLLRDLKSWAGDKVKTKATDSPPQI